MQQTETQHHLLEPREEHGKPTVLVVDDTPDNLMLMATLLEDRYRVKAAMNGPRALKSVRDHSPDLILLDIMMPGMDGFEVCQLLQEDPETRSIPIIFLTAKSDASAESHGLELGAVDYITKPINPQILLARVHTHLQLKESSDFLRDKNAFLEKEIRKRTHETAMVQKATILSLAALAETRDTDTGGHLWRTQRYIQLLANELRNHPDFEAQLSDQYIQMIFDTAPLHDIGKVGIPDQILLKPGRLTPEEFEIVKKHPQIGNSTILRAEKALGTEVEFLKTAREIILSHHEKWDGSGYPEQLAGDEIPLSARLMALADVYDSLISNRVYRKAMSMQEVVDIIVEGRGSHFDPRIVDAFLDIRPEFESIVSQCKD